MKVAECKNWGILPALSNEKKKEKKNSITLDIRRV